MVKKKYHWKNPCEMKDGNLTLEVIEMKYVDGQTLYYEFGMYDDESWELMGWISITIGDERTLKFWGVIGYTVKKKFRGNRLATRSVKLVVPFIQRHKKMSEISICCDPDNVASRKTAEGSGFKLKEIVEVPIYCKELRKRGHNRCCRYIFPTSEENEETGNVFDVKSLD